MKTTLAITSVLAMFAVGCGQEMDKSAAESQLQDNAPTRCSIQSRFGGYLTAVGGGGRTYDAIHADATQVRAWETFTLVDSRTGQSNIEYGIRTSSGKYLTAVGGGGRIKDVIHSTATSIGPNERFQLNSLGGGKYTISVSSGRYFIGHAGQIPDVLHSDSTNPKSWEQFRVKCGI